MSSRLARHLVWEPVKQPAVPVALFTSAALLPPAEEPAGIEALRIDSCVTAREAAIYLLHVGAEIEHMLMVQYLYAGFSLGGPHLTPEQNEKAASWRANILKTAREEMAHLATVQNLLTLIGGPVTFDREDFPEPSGLYPFLFELEPLTKRSVAKYVLAEAPDEATLARLNLTQEVREIEAFVDGSLAAEKIHRVGIVYDHIKQLFTFPLSGEDPEAPLQPFIPSRDISSDSLNFQVRPEEWGLDQPDLLIKSVVDRDAAAAAILAISTQGEGSSIDDLPSSHFGRFLEIYRNFPDDWSPSKPVARNPKLCRDEEGELITNPLARLWADLLNTRYRFLLMLLTHSFHIESTAIGETNSPRGLLISWAFGEMYHLRSISEIIMSLPLDESSGEKRAGPPFLMPYSLVLPAHDRNRWRGHRDLLEASNIAIRHLLDASPAITHAFLAAFRASNERAILQIAPLIGD